MLAFLAKRPTRTRNVLADPGGELRDRLAAVREREGGYLTNEAVAAARGEGRP